MCLSETRMELSFIKGYSVLNHTKRKGDISITLLIRDGIHFEKQPNSSLSSLQAASVLGLAKKN